MAQASRRSKIQLHIASTRTRTRTRTFSWRVVWNNYICRYTHSEHIHAWNVLQKESITSFIMCFFACHGVTPTFPLIGHVWVLKVKHSAVVTHDPNVLIPLISSFHLLYILVESLALFLPYSRTEMFRWDIEKCNFNLIEHPTILKFVCKFSKTMSI